MTGRKGREDWIKDTSCVFFAFDFGTRVRIGIEFGTNEWEEFYGKREMELLWFFMEPACVQACCVILHAIVVTLKS